MGAKRSGAEVQRRWRKANPQLVKANRNRWNALNRAKICASEALRRARKRNLVSPLTAAEHLRINALYAEAIRRTAETGIVHHVDHDKPLALGGVHHPDNMLVVPASINLAKAARYASTWDFIAS